jgi:uncharacterized membrane protein
MERRLLVAVAVLSAAGALISTYSLLHNQGLASGEFCTIGETFNCDVVNKGAFSRMFGIPVSLIGVGGYVLLCASALLALKDPKDRGLKAFLALSAAGGLAFSLYLTSLEAFVLHTWCLVCLSSQAVILTVFVLSLAIVYHAFRKLPVTH